MMRTQVEMFVEWRLMAENLYKIQLAAGERREGFNQQNIKFVNVAFVSVLDMYVVI